MQYIVIATASFHTIVTVPRLGKWPDSCLPAYYVWLMIGPAGFEGDEVRLGGVKCGEYKKH